MFDVNLRDWDAKAPEDSMFQKYGSHIKKFGIAFETDSGMITHSPRTFGSHAYRVVRTTAISQIKDGARQTIDLVGQV